MHHLEFTSLYSYAAEREGISVPISLKVGVKTVSPVPSVDNGASFCIFRAELAELLGLNPANCSTKRFRAANSTFDTFGQEVEISALCVSTHAMIHFFADAAINKNVLGRPGWLDRVRLGLIDMTA